MLKINRIFSSANKRAGFSLAEMVTTLLVGSMIIVCVIEINSRVQNASSSIIRKIEKTRVPNEILQLIAEDLDGIIGQDPSTKIVIVGNKIEKGYVTSRLEILKTYTDKNSTSQTLERIVWQGSFDRESDVNGLVLYRGQSGIIPEDPLLDKGRSDEEKQYNFIPVCKGITYFRIQVIGDDPNNPVNEWAAGSMPSGVIIGISFAEPFKATDGQIDVFEDEKTIRTICIDRTRKPVFNITIQDIKAADSNDNKKTDANTPDPNKIKKDANDIGKRITK